MTIIYFAASMHYVTGHEHPVNVSIRQHSRIRGLYVLERRDSDGYRMHGSVAHAVDDMGNLVQVDTGMPIAHSLRDGAGYLEAALFN